MSYNKIFQPEDWMLDGKDVVLQWSDNTYRFTISTKIPYQNPFSQSAYKQKIKVPYTLFDAKKSVFEVYNTKKHAQRVVLERLVDSFFKDVEEQIKSL